MRPSNNNDRELSTADFLNGLHRQISSQLVLEMVAVVAVVVEGWWRCDGSSVHCCCLCNCSIVYSGSGCGSGCGCSCSCSCSCSFQCSWQLA